MGIKDSKQQMHEAIADMFERNAVVTKKPFDISEHEFSSGDFVDVFTQGKHLHVYIAPYCHGRTWLDKDDAIVIAKALGVTGEDLL